jgi:hypothetical protein
VAIAGRSPLTESPVFGPTDLKLSIGAAAEKSRAMEATQGRFENCVAEGIPMTYKSLTLLLKAGDNLFAIWDNDDIGSSVSSILSRAGALNLIV